MANFQNLQNILDMDFAQMRALPCSSGMRATDEAIQFFVTNLIKFYAQFSAAPTADELKIYTTYMEKITNTINESEYAYYIGKYSSSYSTEEAENMAFGCKLKSFKELPKRMQFWAAAEEFGDSIRNITDHLKAVKKLAQWAAYTDKGKENLFFQPKNKSTPQTPPYTKQMTNRSDSDFDFDSETIRDLEVSPLPPF